MPEREAIGDEIAITLGRARACLDVRGNARDPCFLHAIIVAADLSPPLEPGSSVCGLLASMLSLGPDEWLLVSETQAASDLAFGLERAVAGLHAALTDVTDGLIVYALRGRNARVVLAKGCSIDLHPRAFPPGQCARTLLAKAPVLLHLRPDTPMFELYVARSYAQYAWLWLLSAAQEFLPPAGRSGTVES